MVFSPEYDYSQTQSRHAAQDLFAADAAADVRTTFIRKTYIHLCGAVLAFIALEAMFLSIPGLAMNLVGMIGGHWWLALIAFMAVAWIAEKWANSATSRPMQYAGLALYTLAEAVIFVPLLWIASNIGGPNVIPQAGFLTMLIFVGLTVIVLTTRADFSFLRNVLWLATLAALGVIILSALTGFSLGLFFTAAMIVLMSGYILYYTSNVLHHYHTDQYVAASLALFASLATLFWYVVQLVMALSGDD